MADFPALPLWTDAYLADTMHLSVTESGAYLHLLMAAWRSPDCTLPDDDKKLGRMSRCTPREWNRVRDAVLDFWDHDEKTKTWTQKKLLTVREVVQAKSDRAKHAADTKHRKTKETGDANAGPEHMPEPSLDDATKTKTINPPDASHQSPPRKRATRLPEDWQPSAGDVAFAEKEGLTPDEISRECSKFRDYWHGLGGQRGTKRDWPATWRNWIRRGADDRRNAPNGQRGNGRKTNSVVAAATRSLDSGGREHGGTGNPVADVWGSGAGSSRASAGGGDGGMGRASNAGTGDQGADGLAGGDEGPGRGRGGSDAVERTDGAGTGGISGRCDDERDPGAGPTIDVHAEPGGDRRGLPPADGQTPTDSDAGREGAGVEGLNNGMGETPPFLSRKVA